MKSSGAIETRIVSHVLLFMLEFFKFSRVPSYEKNATFSTAMGRVQFATQC